MPPAAGTMPRGRRPRQDAGFTLIELVLVLGIVGLLAAIAVPHAASFVQAVAVRSAASDVAAALAAARSAAVTRGAHAAVRIDASLGRLTVHAGSDTLLVRDLDALHGVTLETTRDSVAFDPLGLGYGAANTRIIVRRGLSADTVWVARLGRVRKSR